MQRIRPTYDKTGSRIVSYSLVDLITGRADQSDSPLDPPAPHQLTCGSDEFRQWCERGWTECLEPFIAFRQGVGRQAGHRRSAVGNLDGARASDIVQLPEICEPPPPISKLLRKRSSYFGDFRERQLPLAVFSRFLEYGFSALRAHRRGQERERHMLGALSVYVCAYAVAELKPALYRYDVKSHALELVSNSLERERIHRALVGQRGALTADATTLLVAQFPTAQAICEGDIGLQRLYVETGRLMQEAILGAVAAGYKTHISPAVRDSVLLQLMGLEPDQWQVLHTLTIG